MPVMETPAEIVRPNMTPPRGSVPTGEILPDGRLVYRRKRMVKVGVREMKDPAGRTIFKKPIPGLPPEPRMEPVMEEQEYEFILRPNPFNGMVYEQEDFRQSKEEIAAEAARAEIAAGQTELAELVRTLRAEGITPSDLVAAIRGRRDEQPDDGADDAEKEANRQRTAAARAKLAEKRANGQ